MEKKVESAASLGVVVADGLQAQAQSAVSMAGARPKAREIPPETSMQQEGTLVLGGTWWSEAVPPQKSIVKAAEARFPLILSHGSRLPVLRKAK